ncbi:MAG: hypothetical protein U1F87_18355 [Kiritimatiellia bacterium]
MFALKPLSGPAPDARVRLVGFRLVTESASPSGRIIRDLPCGLARNYPVTLLGANAGLAPGCASTWFSESLRAAVLNPVPGCPPVEIRGRCDARRVALLNVLDDVYGHAFQKLLSVQRQLDAPDAPPVIVLAPKMFAWMIPDGVAETWLVDAPLRSFATHWTGLDEWFAAQMNRFNEVLLCPAGFSPDMQTVRPERFFRTAPFPLDQFWKRTPTITFVPRPDRLWTDTEGLSDLALGLQKHGVAKPLLALLRLRQNALLRATARRIRKALPDAVLQVAGPGKPGGFPDWIRDLRVERPAADDELAWCRAFAASHVVIGVHGSNMHIPTALAAGFVEIQPRRRLPNMTQDISSGHRGRKQIFLARHLPLGTPVRTIAENAVSLILNYPNIHLNEGIEHEGPDGLGSAANSEAFFRDVVAPWRDQRRG